MVICIYYFQLLPPIMTETVVQMEPRSIAGELTE
jgi:hypothetical protein